MSDALDQLKATTQVLLQALRNKDLDKGHEAISVLLTQGMTMLGRDSPVMQQFFPVWDAIEKHINRLNVADALGQTEIWDRQLDEVIAIVRSARR